jgi:AcrR family transcriptional regulator
VNLRLEQKAERRTRILAAAREIVAARGYEALTMRDLARAADVTVPTIYNLIGSKEAVLFAAVEEQTAGFVETIAGSKAPSPAARILSVVEVSVQELLRLPRYYRSLLRLLLTSGAASPMRDFVTSALTREFERALHDMLRAGELPAWVEPRILAEKLGSHMNMTSLEWAAGELDAAGLRDSSLYGTCLLMLGVAQGSARSEFATCAARTQGGAARPPASRAAPLPAARARS